MNQSRSSAKLTFAKCPKCENVHKVRIFWSGRGIPRCYCKECKKIISHINNAEILEDPTNKIWRDENKNE